MSSSRLLAIATNVFREVIRDRILYLIAFYALLLAAAIWFLPEVAATTENKIFSDFGLAVMELLSLIVAIFVGTGLVSKEIEKRTVLILMAKPISRTEFITGKHLGLSAVLALLVAVMTAIYLAFLHFKDISYPLDSILLAALYLFIELSLMTAVAIVFGVFTSSVLATLLAFAVYLMGHSSKDLVELGRLSHNPNLENLTRGLYLVLPDLSRLDLKDRAVYGMGLLPDRLALLSDAGYGLLYTVLLLAIAILIFSRREF